MNISKKHYIIKNIDLFNINIKDKLIKLSEVKSILDVSDCFKMNSISYEYNNFFLTIENDSIFYYYNGILCYKNTLAFDDATTSIALEETTKSTFINGVNDEILTGMLLIYNLEMNHLKFKRSTRTYCTYYKVREISAEIFKYEYSQEPYVIFKKSDKTSILMNYMYRKLVTLPTVEYPLVNNNNSLKIFYNDNCKKIQDNDKLNQILKGYQGEIGKCFKNSEEIIQRLCDNGYDGDHTIDYYSGWLLDAKFSNAVVHAWVVIDDCSVIDVGVFNEQTDNKYLLSDKIFNGKTVLNRELLAKSMKQIKDDKNSYYSMYYNYGDCGRYLYAGVKTTREEAGIMFKRYLEKTNNPFYNNVDKSTGENKLQKIYQQL